MKSLMIVITAVCLGFNARAALHEDVQTADDAQNAIVLINHIGWEVSRIMEMKERASLEAEYEKISIDQLNLKAIKDKEIVDQIRALSTYITWRRIDSQELEMLQLEYEFNRDNALYDAFPSPSAIVAANWQAIAYNLVQSTISSYMNYKKSVASLEIKHKRNVWEVEKSMIRDLDEMYQQLFDNQQKLTHQYNLDDYWRVSPRQAKYLIAYIETEDVEGREEELFKFLNHVMQRKTYQKLPVYWYYLGVAAEKSGHKDVAMEAYNMFQSEFCQILRFDRTAASVAMNKANLLLEQSVEPDAVREQLAIIEHNMKYDWTFMYYCASVYLRLNDIESARRTIDQASIILRQRFDNALQRTVKACENGALAVEEQNLPNAMPLIACQLLRLKIDGGAVSGESVRSILDETQRNWGRNSLGALSFCGQVPFKEIEDYLMPSIKGICLEYQHDDSFLNNPVPYRFVLAMPYEWLFAGHIDVSAVVKFDDGSRDVTLRLHPRYEGVNPRILSDRMVQYIIDCPSEIVRYRSPMLIELRLEHKFYPVTFVIDATPLKKVKKTGDQNVRLDLMEFRYKKNAIRFRNCEDLGGSDSPPTRTGVDE